MYIRQHNKSTRREGEVYSSKRRLSKREPKSTFVKRERLTMKYDRSFIYKSHRQEYISMYERTIFQVSWIYLVSPLWHYLRSAPALMLICIFHKLNKKKHQYTTHISCTFIYIYIYKTEVRVGTTQRSLVIDHRIKLHFIVLRFTPRFTHGKSACR